MENHRILLYFTLFFITYLLWAEWQMDYGPKPVAPISVEQGAERVQAVAETRAPYTVPPIAKEEIVQLIRQLESQMKVAAKNLEFEKAALIRDRIIELRKDEELFSPMIKR